MFTLLVMLIIIQRLTELVIAARNEKWMKSQGGIEVGQVHYRYMVMIHSFFFVILIGEVLFFQKDLSPAWPLLLPLFLITQFGRVWVIATLKKYWNTKIIILPNAKVIENGPYRYLRHPNYVIVTIEIVVIPLLFQAYITAFLFTVLNIWILSIRIPEEEKALLDQTEYAEIFLGRKRFIPSILKKL